MSKTAKIVRMVASDHLCPWGVKAIDLLRRNGFEIEDEQLASMEANKKYKEENGYDETPQIWIEDEYIGNYGELRIFLGVKDREGVRQTYQPVIAIFAMCFLMAMSTTYTMTANVFSIRVVELFISFSMVVLAIQKLQDLKTFTAGFVQYDLLAQKFVPYGYVYPFIEGGAGVLMIAGLLTWVAAPLALFISTIGAISVIKAVYVEKKGLECACAGAGNDVPLGFLSLIENLMMIAMSIWMMIKAS